MLRSRPNFTPGRKPTVWPGQQSFAAPAVVFGMGTAVPKENVIVSEAYKDAVRSLPCQRCGYPPRSQFCHADEGKGNHIKTDDRRGWAGCGPRPGTMGCHYLVGTSGTFTKLVRRAIDEAMAAKTRAALIELGKWPKNVPFWPTNQASGQHTRTSAAINSGVTP